MKIIAEKRLPLIIISGIFLSLIIIINFSSSIIHRTPSEKLQIGLLKLIEEDYELFGEIGIKGKTEETLAISDIHLLYSSVINNSSHRMMMECFVTSDLFNFDKKLGDVYKSQNKIILKPEIDQYDYLYMNTPENNIAKILPQDKITKIINIVKDKIIEEGKEAILIKSNHMDLKIISNKISIQLKNEDLGMLLEQVIENRASKLMDALIQLLNKNQFYISINVFIDNQNSINKIEVLFENQIYTISSMHSFHNYNRTSKIAIPDISQHGKNINDMKEKDIMEIIGNLFMTIY